MRRTLIACVLLLGGCMQSPPCDAEPGAESGETITLADTCEWYGGIHDSDVEDGVIAADCPPVDCLGAGNPGDALSYEEVKECARQLSAADSCEALHEAASSGACASCLAY